MKALSIKQPYASVIAEGIKDIENRSQRTHFRGTVYIHASGTWHDRVKTHECFTKAQCAAIIKKNGGLTDFEKYVNPKANNPIPVSSIIGQVDIIDCVVNHKSIWAEHQEGKPRLEYYVSSGLPHEWIAYKEAISIWEQTKPIWNWVLANAVLYDKPILNIKGALSFWEPKPNQSCMNCKEEFFGQEPEYCCDGRECGCMGMPQFPIVCSEECFNKLLNVK